MIWLMQCTISPLIAVISAIGRHYYSSGYSRWWVHADQWSFCLELNPGLRAHESRIRRPLDHQEPLLWPSHAIYSQNLWTPATSMPYSITCACVLHCNHLCFILILFHRYQVTTVLSMSLETSVSPSFGQFCNISCKPNRIYLFPVDPYTNSQF